MKLFSYVVDHDNGHAPNPYFGVCTLAHCKYRKSPTKPRNIVELAQTGDWVVGTGGVSKKSAGHRKLIYAMRVEEKITLAKYWSDSQFKNKKPVKNGTYREQRGDNKKAFASNKKRFVLISWQYYYFGRTAIPIPTEFHGLEKRGPGLKSAFAPEFIVGFVSWLTRNWKPGKHGDPCGYERIACGGAKRAEKCKSSC